MHNLYERADLKGQCLALALPAALYTPCQSGVVICSRRLHGSSLLGSCWRCMSAWLAAPLIVFFWHAARLADAAAVL